MFCKNRGRHINAGRFIKLSGLNYAMPPAIQIGFESCEAMARETSITKTSRNKGLCSGHISSGWFSGICRLFSLSRDYPGNGWASNALIIKQCVAFFLGLAHRNRSDFCDLRLRCPSRTPEIAAISERRGSNAAL